MLGVAAVEVRSVRDEPPWVCVRGLEWRVSVGRWAVKMVLKRGGEYAMDPYGVSCDGSVIKGEGIHIVEHVVFAHHRSDGFADAALLYG